MQLEGARDITIDDSGPIGLQFLAGDVERMPQTIESTTTVAGPSDAQLRLQRCFDILVASIGLVVVLVPALVFAVMIKSTSRGPILFRQDRAKRHAGTFTVYKFRTMSDGTHQAVLSDAAARAAYRDNDYKLPPDDPRITRVGKFLRMTSLDELPQLLNVLRGQMSIVGVRPLLEEELAARPVADQTLYRRMRPGMTGLWQVEGRSTIRSADRLRLDREYLEHWTFWGDVKIAFRTPFALLRIHRAH